METKSELSPFQKIIEKQQEYLNAFFAQLNLEQVEKLVDKIQSTKGLVIFSGVGKSGIVAEKLAKTFVSIGLRSINLSPTDALHGDLGMVSKDDLFIAISKSGQTKELIELTKLLNARSVPTVSWVSEEKSLLESLANLSVYLPVKGEICPLDLAPTTSAAIQLIFGDMVAARLMQQRQFSVEQFALNHPGGSIGRSISLRVKDIMFEGNALPTARADETLKEAIVEFTNKRCGCLIIVDQDQKALGIYTDGDLRRTIGGGKYPDPLQVKMGELMNGAFRFISKEARLSEAKRLMQGDPEKKIMVLPVLDEGRLIGLVHLHDVV
ncbi:MAG: Arabinose 5-phosphate isomerase KdsD [Chlamydiia bacterium]|nr:Arabinose 5-phosphate isomerase KdsD [Chlamydiia bacterium]